LWLNPILSASWAAGITVLVCCVSTYLLAEAVATHDVLGRLRHELLKEDSYALVPRKSVQTA